MRGGLPEGQRALASNHAVLPIETDLSVEQK